VDIIDDKIDDYIIYSPLTGKIINFNPEIGEQIQLGEPVVSVLVSDQYYIIVNIPEVYINDIEVGDAVKISINTFGKDKKFKGEVFFIGTDEKLVQDLVYYETKIKFVDVSEDELKKMKPKMTTNISIDANSKKDVLVVPARAIKEKEKENGEAEKYLRILGEDEKTMSLLEKSRQREKLMKNKQQEKPKKPFVPSSFKSKLDEKYCPYEYKGDPEQPVQRKKDTGDRKPKFKPFSGPKTKPTRSVLFENCAGNSTI
jgi:hypothetical protein